MDNGYSIRPTSLLFHHIKHHPQCHESVNFIREAFTVWNTSATKLNRVPDGKVQDAFYKLNLYPTTEQVNDMLQRLYSSSIKYRHGLSFGEFSVLAADFRKFRTSNQNGSDPFQITSLSPKSTLRIKKNISFDEQAPTASSAMSTTQVDSSSENDESKKEALEVFLGGSCNPTTWRADVAMPALKKLGISYYNPQVSQWTPDLIELEHRAKEKARVLFFVMDSETRASAGAIEAAHIAGLNTKPLVLVLHPYKMQQTILNETISEEEYLDLSRNQKLLKQLVTRKGLPVLDSIPSGLQKIKGILSGKPACQDLPKNLGSRLISVRRSYDRFMSNSCEIGLTISQCHQALSTLGYRRNIINLENLKQILRIVRDVLHNNKHETSPTQTTSSSSSSSSSSSVEAVLPELKAEQEFINFEEFCIMSSYLSVLQQEINENSCVSPIKGTNLPPPPVFLTNAPEHWIHNQFSKQCSHNDDINNSIASICQRQTSHGSTTTTTNSTNYSKILNSSSSSASSSTDDHRHSIVNGTRSDNSSRDSGTSSPQPNEIKLLNGNSGSSLNTKIHIDRRIEDAEGKRRNRRLKQKSTAGISAAIIDDGDSDDSDDSVFSTGSSMDEEFFDEHRQYEARDIYLGGSCMLRTKWRQDFAIPFLRSKKVGFYLPTLHENLTRKQLNRRTNNKSGIIVAGSIDNDIVKEHEQTYEDGGMMYNPNILDSSRVLLFVITNETRSLAPMTLAAHYIGLGYNVVLCVQMLPDNCTIGNDQLTPSAIKDYNRGRSYLIDLAKRKGIHVFNEIKAALNCAINEANLNCKTPCPKNS